jgi:hypothetical protein
MGSSSLWIAVPGTRAPRAARHGARFIIAERGIEWGLVVVGRLAAPRLQTARLSGGQDRYIDVHDHHKAVIPDRELVIYSCFARLLPNKTLT